jgi:hypothetical protein
VCEMIANLPISRRQGMHMRSFIAIAIVVAIGLIWSVVSITKVVPVASAELLAATPPHTITAGQGKSAAVY